MSQIRKFRKTRLLRAFEALENRVLFDTLYVDTNAAGPVHDGTTWDAAYLQIQDALTAAIAGDEIRVADGTYVSTFASRINLKNNVSMLGGFAGYGAVHPDARDVAAHVSLISGPSGHNDGLVIAVDVYAPTVFDGFTVQSSGWGTVSLRTSSATLTINNCIFRGGMGINNVSSAPTITDCLFDGLEGGTSGGGMTNSGILSAGQVITIQNCRFINCHGNTGGAMRNSGTAVVVMGCTFTGNAAAHEGQVIYNGSSSATFIDCTITTDRYIFDPDRLVYNVGPSALSMTRCTFSENYGNGYGGIIYSASSRPVSLTECIFTRNSSDYVGGGIYASGSSSLSVTSCVFQGNSAYGYGGAIYADVPEVHITNSVFSGNTVSHGGGAIYLADGAATITNCTFSGNTVGDTYGQGGAILLSNATLYLRNSILAGDVAGDGMEIGIAPIGSTSVHYQNSIVAAPDPWGVESFVRLPSAGTDGYYGTLDDDYGDLRLRLSAGTVDAGENAYVPGGITTDIAGNPRFADVPGTNDPGAIVDIGAYEYVVPLAVTSGAYLVDVPQPTISVVFNGDVKDWATLSAGDLVVLNPVTNLPVGGPPIATVTYDEETRTAKWVFAGALPDGNYRAKIAAGSVTDLNGNPLSADFTFDFFVLGGDANHDRRVDAHDLFILAQNWLGTGKTFGEADFNYDGIVDKLDLTILAQAWQQKLDEPSLPPVPAAPVPTADRRAPIRTPVRAIDLVQ